MCLCVHVSVLFGNLHAPVMSTLDIVDCPLQTFGKYAVVLYLTFRTRLQSTSVRDRMQLSMDMCR